MTLVELHLASAPEATILVNLDHVLAIRRLPSDPIGGLVAHTRLTFVAPTRRSGADNTVSVIETPAAILALVGRAGMVPLR